MILSVNSPGRSSLLACGALLVAMSCTAWSSDNKQIAIDDSTFKCMQEMTPVRGFFVTNLLGKLDDTLKVANSPTGGRYPPGSVVQLVPTEVMVKHKEGWNPATKDWEFFELTVSDAGSKIMAARRCRLPLNALWQFKKPIPVASWLRLSRPSRKASRNVNGLRAVYRLA
jgi:hypothetical protein